MREFQNKMGRVIQLGILIAGSMIGWGWVEASEELKEHEFVDPIKVEMPSDREEDQLITNVEPLTENIEKVRKPVKKSRSDIQRRPSNEIKYKVPRRKFSLQNLEVEKKINFADKHPSPTEDDKNAFMSQFSPRGTKKRSESNPERLSTLLQKETDIKQPLSNFSAITEEDATQLDVKETDNAEVKDTSSKVD